MTRKNQEILYIFFCADSQCSSFRGYLFAAGHDANLRSPLLLRPSAGCFPLFSPQSRARSATSALRNGGGDGGTAAAQVGQAFSFCRGPPPPSSPRLPLSSSFAPVPTSNGENRLALIHGGFLGSLVERDWVLLFSKTNTLTGGGEQLTSSDGVENEEKPSKCSSLAFRFHSSRRSTPPPLPLPPLP